MTKNAAALRIALLGSRTLTHVPECAASACAAYDLQPQWYVAPYQQYEQEARNPASGLYAFDPDLLIVVIDTKTLLQWHDESPHRLTATGRRRAARAAARQLMDLVQRVARQTRGLILLHNLEVPIASPMGILETKQEFGLLAMVRWINQTLETRFRQDPRVFVFDYDGFVSRVGKQQARDPRLAYLADMPLAPSVWRQLGAEYARYLLALQGRAKKCVVVDLDHTLWGGTIGEDGLEGIQLGPTPPGNVFVAFQHYLLALFERGILLAINSHNNPEEALRVIREHPAMVLREEHFAAIAINWESKTENLRMLAEELRLGLDSFVMLDDDPAQRLLMREQLPEVSVVELPQDPAEHLGALQRFVGLDALQLTTEDLRRGALYAHDRRRRELRRTTQDLDEFLAQLNTRVSLRAADPFSLPRLAQLTQRTNQFHLTLQRATESELADWLAQPGTALYAIEVADRFGDQGISGALGIRREASRWDLPLLLLSCRVLGKGVEEAVLGIVVGWAREAGVEELRCASAVSEKNVVARRFLERFGFLQAGSGDRTQEWRLNLSQAPKPPAFIAVRV